MVNRGLDLLFVPGTERFWVSKLMGEVIVLVYHRVSADTGQDFLDRGGVPRITPQGLTEELGFLANLGARFLTFRDLRQGIFPAASEFGLIVTFDDGFRDSYEQGLPVVEALGGQAVVFQCTAMLDQIGLLPEHRLYHLLFGCTQADWSRAAMELVGRIEPDFPEQSSETALVNYCLRKLPAQKLQNVLDSLPEERIGNLSEIYPDDSLIQSAHANGHEIGSHGHRHLHRATLNRDKFEQELLVSHRRLTEVLGKPPAVFSYPFGAVNKGDAQICGRNYLQAVTCERKRIVPDADLLKLGRFSWPGQAANSLRFRRWLLTGSI